MAVTPAASLPRPSAARSSGLRFAAPEDDRCIAPLPRRALLALLALAPLAACGFRPLYGTPAYEGSVAAELAAIRVARVVAEDKERRLGQVLANELTDRFTAGTGPAPQRYVLNVEIEQRTSELQIQTTDTVTRYNLTLRARFQLLDSATREVLYRGTARAIGSYDVVESEYATLVAEQQTARDAARDLSNTIAHLLALYFQRRDI